MKKIALFLSLIFVFTLAACAQQAPAVEPTPAPQETGTAETETAAEMIAGIVIEITDEGILIENDAQGEVLALIGEETVFETTGDIAAGDYVYIDYDGQMTFSLPAQIGASLVRMHKLEGDISEVYAEENAVLLHNEETGDVKDEESVKTRPVDTGYEGLPEPPPEEDYSPVPEEAVAKSIDDEIF